MSQEMEVNAGSSQDATARPPIPEQHLPFLKKVMAQGNVPDPYDARDITEVVFRIMRDLMTTESADRVGSELHEAVIDPADSRDKSLQELEVSDLWKDTNPIVGLLSRVRPPWQGPGIFKIDSDRFLFRAANEAAMPPGCNQEQVVGAVFSATKAELSPERVQEIAKWMPEGRVSQLWNEA